MVSNGGTHSTNAGVRRVVLTTGPQLHPFSTSSPDAAQNYYCLALDTKGFQIQVDLQAIPPGVTIDQIQQNQVWWVEKRTSLYRLYLYAGTYDPTTRQINSTDYIPTSINNVVVSGTPTNYEVLTATSSSGATWEPISNVINGAYLTTSGGTIKGKLTVASGLTVSGNISLSASTGTTGQVMSAGTPPTWSSSIPLIGKGSALAGSAPSIPGPFSIIAGYNPVSFSAGYGILAIDGGGFPNGLLSFTANAMGGSSVRNWSLTIDNLTAAPSKAAIDLYLATSNTGTGVTGTVNISYIAIGW